MEKKHIVSKLNEKFSSSIDEIGSIGGGKKIPLVWVKKESVINILKFIKESFQMDLLENLSVAHLNQKLMITYFLRSYESPYKLAVRVLVAAREKEPSLLPSVSSLWLTAIPMENEAEELFGLVFQNSLAGKKYPMLPENWSGYPMRKDFMNLGSSPRGLE